MRAALNARIRSAATDGRSITFQCKAWPGRRKLITCESKATLLYRMRTNHQERQRELARRSRSNRGNTPARCSIQREPVPPEPANGRWERADLATGEDEASGMNRGPLPFPGAQEGVGEQVMSETRVVRRSAEKEPPTLELVLKRNSVERIKREKDPLGMLGELPALIAAGYEQVPEEDLVRLKWWGLYHDKPKIGTFMLRIKLPAGRVTPAQLRAVGELSLRYGKGSGELSTRQTIQLHYLE